MARYRCAILDDYQNVVLKVTDWSKVAGDIDIKVFNEHLGGADNVVKALQGFGIVCAMRERTGFPSAVIEKLPDLKLLITTGLRNASIDVAAAKPWAWRRAAALRTVCLPMTLSGAFLLLPVVRSLRSRRMERPCSPAIVGLNLLKTSTNSPVISSLSADVAEKLRLVLTTDAVRTHLSANRLRSRFGRVRTKQFLVWLCR